MKLVEIIESTPIRVRFTKRKTINTHNSFMGGWVRYSNEFFMLQQFGETKILRDSIIYVARIDRFVMSWSIYWLSVEENGNKTAKQHMTHFPVFHVHCSSYVRRSLLISMPKPFGISAFQVWDNTQKSVMLFELPKNSNIQSCWTPRGKFRKASSCCNLSSGEFTWLDSLGVMRSSESNRNLSYLSPLQNPLSFGNRR